MSCFLTSTKTLASTAIMTAALLAAAPAQAGSDILFILDGSGSMWGKIDGTAKIATAKKTMAKLIDDVPADARLGFMTYGTTSKKSCQDVSMMNAVGANRAAIKQNIAALSPLGKTPIQKSLIDGLAVLEKSEPADTQKSLVLISDGIETCNGDPCAVAASAQHRGVGIKIHVVGFDVDGDARQQLECIAEKGGGQYFNAADTAGFKKAMDAVVQVAQATPVAEETPEPTTTITEVFRDDFDGEGLGANWTVENPNPDNYLIEDGNLIMLSTTKGGLEAAAPENLITYNGELPKGDWDVVITFTGDYGAISDRLYVGLRKNKDNYLGAFYGHYFPYPGTCHKMLLQLRKNAGGKLDKNTINYRSTKNSLDCPDPYKGLNQTWDEIRADHQEKPLTLTLSKRGRGYTATVALAGYRDKDGQPIIATTEQFTSLRAPGNLAIAVDRPVDGEGEVLMNIDSIVINEVQ